MKIFKKKFLKEDVLTAARRRFDLILERWDDAFVGFSGGKDSLVCLHLMREAFARAGKKSPVKVCFYDEELIPDAVINFVDSYRRLDWIDLTWFCFPLASNKFVLGKVDSYLQWDPDRKHVREIPPWSIRPAPGRKGPFSQYTMVEEMLHRCRGSVADVVGIRADESLTRYTVNACKLHDNWIRLNEVRGITNVNPIFDWTENDIFKYLGENKIPYCGIYDAQLYSKTPFRVSTPVHSGSAKRFDRWRKMDPDFHRRVTEVFPEMMLQERYYDEIKRDGGEPSIEALEAWVAANVPEALMGKALEIIQYAERDLNNGWLTVADWPKIWQKFTTGTWVKGDKLVQVRRPGGRSLERPG